MCVSQLFPKELFVPFFVTLNNTKTLNKKMTAAGPILSLGNCDFTSSSSFDAREREREKTRHAQPSFSFELHFKNSESREANDTPLREREREREVKKQIPFLFQFFLLFFRRRILGKRERDLLLLLLLVLLLLFLTSYSPLVLSKHSQTNRDKKQCPTAKTQKRTHSRTRN